MSWRIAARMGHQVEDPGRHSEAVTKIPPISDTEAEITVLRISIMIYGKMGHIFPELKHARGIREHHFLRPEVIPEPHTCIRG